MIKIEKLLDNATATFVRENKTIPVFAGQILTDYEGTTLQVLTGTVMYSIDESKIVNVSAEDTGKSLELNLDTKSTVESTDTVETATEAATVTETVEVTEAVVAEVAEPVVLEVAEPVVAETVQETAAPVIVVPAPRKK